MAIIWQKTVNHTHYEVRRSGASLRLYTNGVFHSQYNEAHPLAGSVWDLLVLPALMRPQHSIKRALVLGVGAGAAIRQLQALVQPALIIGIELDATHLHVATKLFEVNNGGDVALHQANAVHWLEAYNGPGFDLIIEDLFIDHNGEPQRAVPANEKWCTALLKKLAPNGTLVMNFDSNTSLRSSALCRAPLQVDRRRQQKLKQSYVFKVPGYDNRIGAYFTGEGSGRQLEQNLQRLKKEFGASSVARMKAQWHKYSR